MDTTPRPRPEDPAAAEQAESTDDHVTEPADHATEPAEPAAEQPASTNDHVTDPAEPVDAPLTPPFAEDGDDEPAAHTEGSDHSTAAPATYDPAAGVGMPGGSAPAVVPTVTGPGEVALSSALVAGWHMFRQSWLTWVGAVLVWVGVSVALSAAQAAVTPDGEINALPWPLALVLCATTIAAVYASMAVYRGAFEAVDGRVVTPASFFRLGRWPALLGALLASAVICAIALLPSTFLLMAATVIVSDAITASWIIAAALLAVVASIVIAPLSTFVVLVVMDGAQARTAISTAWAVARPHYAYLVYAMLVLSVIGTLGALVLGIGLLVTLPVTTLATVYLYRVARSARRPALAPY